MVRRKQQNLNNLEYKSNKNEVDLSKKENDELELTNIPELCASPKVMYDSGWEVCIIEKFEEAVSTTFEELLPEKASYNFTKRLQIAEDYLPFLRYHILFQTVPEQSLRNVGEFNFTSLNDLQLQLYDWNGNTQQITVYDLSPFVLIPSVGWRYQFYGDITTSAIPISLGGTAGDFWAELPQPETAYEYQAYWSTIKITNILLGIGPYTLSADGTQVKPGSEWISINQWVNDVYTQYSIPDAFQSKFEVSASVSNTFKVDANNYPVPIGTDADYVLPYGTTTNPVTHSTPTYPTQYWSVDDTCTFDELITSYGWSYADALSLFTEFYSNVIVTQDEDSGEYHAYEQIETTVVKSCNQQIFYDKVATKEFDIRVKGNALLMSKAITETSYSDPLAPTYEPNGEDLFVRLIITVEPKIRTATVNYVKKIPKDI